MVESRRRIFSGAPWESLAGYARAVVSGDFIFVAGTIGRDPVTGDLPETVTAQCANALKVIEHALTDAGGTFADVVRVTYYVADREDFEPCWPLLRATFGDHPPASTVVVAGLLEAAMRIEIEVTAHRAR